MRTLVLFTRDLRVHDHPALAAACRRGADVLPLFVLDPALTAISPNRHRFLLECLADLDRELGRRGGRLVLRRGEAAAVAVTLAVEAGCDSIHVTADVGTVAGRRERDLADHCRQAGIALEVVPGNAVVEPGEVVPAGRDVYSVFTPYHQAWVQTPRRSILQAPATVPVPREVDPGPRPDLASVAPDSPRLPAGGESAGRALLQAWVAGPVRRYGAARDLLAADGTSRLSPYLRFGCISANEVVHRSEPEEFVRQIAWRDFYRQLLGHDPRLSTVDHRRGDVVAPPPNADELLDAWRRGRTGIPLVDAGMRQLLEEGWMHNRARMVVGSFLTRRLGIPWQEGARHFLRLLVDGDPANNSGGWQWVAGTGTDPRRSRSFNPVLQAQRYDPDGVYIHRWVSELAGVAPPLLFAPWSDPSLLRTTAYPEPVLQVPTKGSGARRVPGSPVFGGQASFDGLSGAASAG